MAAKHPPDLMLIDIRMPGGLGSRFGAPRGLEHARNANHLS